MIKSVKASATVHTATPEMEAVYKDAAIFMQTLCARHPTIRTIEILAILGRMCGYAAATCFPAERDLAKQTVIENMNMACLELAPVDGPSGPVGHA